MNKFYLILIIVLASVLGYSQSTSKNFVVIEIGTGTWCWACPYASIPAEQLLADGKNVIIIKNSFEDEYQTEASLSRLNFYGTNLYPDTYFNGVSRVSGVPEDNDFITNYETEINKLTSFTMEADYTFADGKYNVNITTTKVADYNSSNLILHVFLTESHIDHMWQNMIPTIDYSNRKMYPNTNGTSLDFTNGNTVVKNLNIALDEVNNDDNCTIVALIQNTSTKEILQATQLPLGYMQGENNVAIEEIIIPNTTNCFAGKVPQLVIRNRGNNLLTSADISIQTNQNTSTTQNWSGSLSPNQTDTVLLSSFTSTDLLTDTLKVKLSNPNNTDDEALEDNYKLKTIINSYSSPLTLTITTNSSNESFYWQILKDGNSVVGKGGFDEDITLTETINLDKVGCYKFKNTDNDGWGSTDITLKDAMGRIIYHNSELIIEKSESVFFNIDKISPTITCNIENNVTNVPVDTNIIIQFDMPIRNIDDSEISADNLKNIITFSTVNNDNVSSIFSINEDFTQITIEPESNLETLTDYIVELAPVESFAGVETANYILAFKTEQTIAVLQRNKVLNVYPNPAANVIFIDNITDANYTIYSINGTKLQTGTIENHSINIHSLAKGSYLLSIRSKNKDYNTKIQIIK